MLALEWGSKENIAKGPNLSEDFARLDIDLTKEGIEKATAIDFTRKCSLNYGGNHRVEN